MGPPHWHYFHGISNLKGGKVEDQRVEFHLSIPMRYEELAPLFCSSAESVKYTVNNTMHARKDSPNHPLTIIAETPTEEEYKISKEFIAISD